MKKFHPSTNERHITELVSIFDVAYNNNENLSFKEEEFVLLIQYFLKNNETQKALFANEIALEHYPFSSEFNLSQADVLKEMGDLEEAKYLLLNNFKIDRNDVNYYLILSDIYILQNKNSDALKICFEGIEVCEEFKEDLYHQIADIYQNQFKIDKMLNSLLEAYKIEPLDDIHFHNVCDFLDSNLLLEDKRRFIKKIIDMNPFDANAWLQLGMYYRSKGKYVDALEAFEYVEAIDNTKYDLLNEIAFVYLDEKKFLDCLNLYSSSSLIKYNAVTKQYIKGLCYYYLENDEKAKYHFLEAVELCIHHCDIFNYWLAVIEYESMHYRPALVYIEKSLKEDSKNANYLAMKADILTELNENEKALEIYMDLIKTEPSNLSVETVMKMTLFFAYSEGVESAIDVIEELISNFRQYELYYIMTCIYINFHKEEQAYAAMTRGLQLAFDKHYILFEFEPELKNNEEIQSLIDLYSN